ncbi:MAG: endonuclease/exonuclease/phosphatase family protein [Deltaproteobacteria bacterium]|nr:endonuclease/exonuclease/phosphatase family protein [Deltaproteobacteria bacterium]
MSERSLVHLLASSLLVAVALCATGCPSAEDAGDGGFSSTGRDASARRDAGPDASEEPERPDVGTPIPDSGVTGPADTGTAVTPDGGAALVIDSFWANTQWPAYLTLASGDREAIYGQIWIAGGTDQTGAMKGLAAEIGLGPIGSDPTTWTWTPATFNEDKDNNDEFKAELTAPSSGVHEYAFRYRVTGAVFAGKGEWLMAGTQGPTLGAGEAGKLAVRQAQGRLRVATQNLHCQHDSPQARFDAMAARWAASNVDVVALQEVCEDAATGVGNSADYLARKLSTATGRTWRHQFVQTHLANDVTPEGLGIISALPMAASAVADLPTADFPRKALLSVFASPAGMVALVSTHLSFRQEDAAARVAQAQKVLELVNEWQGGAGKPAGTHALVAGDFNTTPDTAPILTFTVASPAFSDAWAALNPGAPGFSYPSSSPSIRIDYLLARGATTGGGTLEVVEVEQEFAQPFTGSAYVSDHRGFSATLQAP